MFEESSDSYRAKISFGWYWKNEWCYLTGKKDLLLFDSAALANTCVQYNQGAEFDTVKVKPLRSDGFVLEVRHSECPNDFFFRLDLTWVQLDKVIHV